MNKTKETIWFEEGCKNMALGIYPGLSNDKVYNAMQKFADQECILFFRYVACHYIQDPAIDDMWFDKITGNPFTVDMLYSTYKSLSNQNKDGSEAYEKWLNKPGLDNENLVSSVEFWEGEAKRYQQAYNDLSQIVEHKNVENASLEKMLESYLHKVKPLRMRWAQGDNQAAELLTQESESFEKLAIELLNKYKKSATP